jgi:hypothetical protein
MRTVALLLILALSQSATTLADDGAASIAAGGLIVMKREGRIAMAKEVLFISARKVTVDYDFRNDTNADITTEVAFPIPSYSLASDQNPASQGFDDFKLWVEGKPTSFEIEAKAMLRGRDYSALLKSFRIDIASGGNSTSNDQSPQLRKLNSTQKARLIKASLIDNANSPAALWSVEKKYYWLQTFPAHTTIHIRHEYTPVLGNSNNTFWFEQSAYTENDKIEGAKSFCADPALLKILKPLSERKDRMLPLFYVDFVLTTANTWKRPIEDFTLVVERPHGQKSLQTFVSFCWDGPITKLDDDHFSAHTVDFIPKKELHIGFVEVEPWDSAK